MLTGALPSLPAQRGVRWAPSFPTIVELVLVIAAIAVLWPSFERLAQLGGAGRDQRFLDHGIAVAGLPEAVVPAACESVGALAEARVADALCKSRRAAAQPPTRMPAALVQAIARASEAFERPLRDEEQHALGLRAQSESGGAELREQADAVAAIESDINRSQDDCGLLTNWLQNAAPAEHASGHDNEGGDTEHGAEDDRRTRPPGHRRL